VYPLDPAFGFTDRVSHIGTNVPVHGANSASFGSSLSHRYTHIPSNSLLGRAIQGFAGTPLLGAHSAENRHS